MTTKELFLSDKNLSQYWAPIAHSTEFERVCVYARSYLAEAGAGQQEMSGALSMLNVLLTIAENDPNATEFPNPGLIHSFETTKFEKPTETK